MAQQRYLNCCQEEDEEEETCCWQLRKKCRMLFTVYWSGFIPKKLSSVCSCVLNIAQTFFICGPREKERSFKVLSVCVCACEKRDTTQRSCSCNVFQRLLPSFYLLEKLFFAIFWPSSQVFYVPKCDWPLKREFNNIFLPSKVSVCHFFFVPLKVKFSSCNRISIS